MKPAPSPQGGTKYGSRSISAPGANFGFTDGSPNMLAELVDAVIDDGDCVMISRTRDRGAVHVRILADGLVEKWYAGSQIELDTLVQELLDAAQRATQAK